MQPKTSAFPSMLRFLAATAIVVLLAFAVMWSLRPAHVGANQVSVPMQQPVSPQSAAIALPAPNFTEAKRSGASPGNADVGLVENSWDFTAPDGVPGFGPLDPADAQRLLRTLEGPPHAHAPPSVQLGGMINR